MPINELFDRQFVDAFNFANGQPSQFALRIAYIANVVLPRELKA